ncbi:MAG: hypothetical protein HYY91_04650 [Candidatus Omnitrophica bacterium]|nr:hypothetical protein [Candidatus Omnitrophota bacterium]
MKAEKLGMLSALVASLCCLGPAVLALLGLGSLGLGASLGRYHQLFVWIGVALLAAAWWRFVRERIRCRTTGCRMTHGRRTGLVLLVASLVVLFFSGWL